MKDYSTMAIAFRYPSKYFEHLNELDIVEINRRVDEAAVQHGVSLDLVATARRKREEQGRHAMSREEHAAYGVFRKAYSGWVDEKANGRELKEAYLQARSQRSKPG